MTEAQKEKLATITPGYQLSNALVCVALDECDAAIRKLDAITRKMEEDGGLSHIMGAETKNEE